MKKILPILILCLIFGIEHILGSENSLQENNIDIKLNEYEEIMNRYFRGDPRVTTLETINNKIEVFNRWYSSKKNILDEQREKLQKEYKTLDEIKKQIDALDEKLTRIPDQTNKEAVKAYSAEMKKRNDLVDKYNNHAKEYNTKERGYNNSATEFKTETAVRKETLDTEKEKTLKEIEIINTWFNEKKGRVFFAELNGMYAQIIRDKKQTGNSDLDNYINKIQSLRYKLGEIAIKKETKAENGLIIVKTALDSSVESFYIIDTGASLVTITLEMVKALGLEDQLGKKIETSLAGGITVKGQEITIPRISVLGKTAQNIPAIVLPSATVGVDGLLGQSFLKRFIIHIDAKSEPKVKLEEREKK